MSYPDFVWDALRETFVDYEFYVDGKEQPSFVIIQTQFGKHDLAMFKVGLIGTYKSPKQAKNRLKEIVENANVPVRVYVARKRYGSKAGKRQLFAENKITRIDLSAVKEETPFKVFEIKEWA